jgi:hypothetical protein
MNKEYAASDGIIFSLNETLNDSP